MNNQNILNQINDVDDLKKLNHKELVTLANDIRNLIIDVSKKVDLHFSSNMGIIELTISILKIFDIKKDTILYDTGHQTYAHKILTDRRDKFPLIKQANGLCGLMNMSESKYDHYSPGHSGNILSVASGLYQSFANDNIDNHGLYKNEKNIIAVVGDSAFANGLTFEALNDISFHNEPLIIILNDNDMSISKSVGALSVTFNKLKTNKFFHNLEKIIRFAFKYNNVYKFIFKTFYKMQWKLIGKNLFEQLGFNYIGPINGHNFKELEDGLTRAKWFAKQGPIIVHVKTKKGKGHEIAENDKKGNYHSLINDNKKSYGMYATDYLIGLMQQYNDIRVINPAMTCASNCDLIAKAFPNYYFDVGIAEEHAFSKASGISLGGLTPYVYIYATFLQRAYDQLQHDLSRLNLKCNLLIDRADIAPAEGATHHGIHDVSLLKTIPNSIITAPRNIHQLKQLIKLSYQENKNHVFAIRYPRTDFLKLDNLNKNFKITWGTWEFLKKSNAKTVVITFGPYANVIYDQIAKNLNVDLINTIFIHGYNKKWLPLIFNKYENIIIYERIFGTNGLIKDFNDYKANHNLTNNIISFHYDGFIDYGTLNEIEKKQKMSIDDLKNVISKLI